MPASAPRHDTAAGVVVADVEQHSEQLVQAVPVPNAERGALRSVGSEVTSIVSARPARMRTGPRAGYRC